ncbi:MAG: ATP-binding protein [Gemmatimonadota bacterium]|nr:ATP-binding protein [Gemmatimonadota bacterium]
MSEQAISILLVDDDQIDRLAVRRALSKAALGEVTVIEAERASEAFAQITATSFDCAFFDFRLPDQDGVALLRNVRSAGVRTPVIVLTGFGDEQTVLDAMKAGATDYVAKSAVSPERIGQAVRAAMRLGLAERQAAAAKNAEERYASQLRGLADAAVAVNSAESIGELLKAAAKHACLITGAPIAHVKLTGEAALELAEDGADGEWYLASAEEPREMSSPVSVPLPGREGRTIGEVILDVWSNRGRDGFILDQLARLVGGALENVRLYRAAQRATQARDDVLAIVSHDLRNPLHTIVLSASYLADVFLADLPDAALQQTEIIRRAVNRANRLIQDLLDVSRIEAGGLSVSKEPVSPTLLVADALDAMTSTAAAAQVTLSSRADDDLPDVLADRERLLQVFGNLIGNAIKFTPVGGTVVVSATTSDPFSVQFSVRDSGQGISNDNLPHIFDRFWQARHAKRTGAGLGLAIARGIVEAHDGTVSATSELGVGTEISFQLPVA